MSIQKWRVYGGVVAAVVLMFLSIVPLTRAALPNNFQVTQIVGSGLNGPSGFGIAPDGRIFILERSGAIKIYKGGQLLAAPFATLPSAGTGDRGLIGVAFDPEFSINHFAYFYYTATDDLLNRLVRFDASSDVATGSPVIMYQTSTPSQFLHSGGTVAFGPDGKIYLAIGDNGYPPNAQDLSVPYGKILRINRDGSMPDDNPFIGQANALPEIWAYGFRNPWRFQFDSVTGKLMAGDVGESYFEEVDDVKKGQNYGWPVCEGYCTQFTQPLHAYAHSGPSSAVTAGPIYRGDMFPQEYQGNFFFADYGQGFIKRATFDSAGAISSVQDFDVGAGSVVDLHTAPDGSLYYLTYYPGRLYRINYSTGNHIPVAVASSDVTRGLDPLTVHFSSNGSFDPDDDVLQYAWDFGDGTHSSEASPVKTFTAKGTYVVELTVSDQSTTAQAVPIVVQVGQTPVVSIGTPTEGSQYIDGDTIFYSGHGVDGAGIDLPDANFTTEVRFHHHDHIHPFLGPIQAKNGTFTIPTSGEPDPDTWYEIRITGTDQNGLSATASANIYPKKSRITFVTNPPGLDINLDGTPLHTPTSVLGVVGFNRLIEAPSQGRSNNYYVFESWSDGGPASHTVAFPGEDITLTANFKIGSNGCDNVGTNAFVGCYHANTTLSDVRVIRTDAKIDFNWGAGAPAQGLPVDDFSVRWVGDFTFEGGQYDFTTAMDDGVRLFIDGIKVQDYWQPQSAVPHISQSTITPGVHRVTVEYFEAGGDAAAKLTWVKTGDLPTPVVNCNEPGTGAFNSCFFYQKELTDFKLRRTDAYPLNFDWGLESPDPLVPADNFSASFVGSFAFTADNYEFTVTGDDGVRLYIDNTLVLDKWVDQAPTTFTVPRTLTAGSHIVKLEYFENGGGAVAKLSWKKVGQPELPPVACAPAGTNAFTACYYDNQDFTNLKVARTEAYPLNFDWGLGSPDPGIAPDSFSARFQGNFDFQPGEYTFTVTGDDGVQLQVDGSVVLSKLMDQSPTTYTAVVPLTGGSHAVLLNYYENGGGAVAKLSWKKTGEIVPPTPVMDCNTFGTNVFVGCYYDNKDFTNLKLTRTDAHVQFNYGSESPDPSMGREEFSMRWKGNFTFAEGDYTFHARADDGVRVYVDGVLLIDQWQNQAATTYTAPLQLTAGQHAVVVEYYENWGDAEISVDWSR